jgi:hypothetical protein
MYLTITLLHDNFIEGAATTTALPSGVQPRKEKAQGRAYLK